MNWSKDNKYIEGTYLDFVVRRRIAAFDLDGTLIKVKSGSKFPIDKDDWVFFNSSVINVLKSYYNNNYCIIIISNQNGISKGKQDPLEWKHKLTDICTSINIPIKIYASINNDHYRKPYPTFWNIATSNIDTYTDKSFYCGDACGRKGDHADTDLKFAINCDINFYTPEHIFLKESMETYIPNYNVDFRSIKKIKQIKHDVKYSEKEMIIMIGYPGSGKSTFAKNYFGRNDYKIINMDTCRTKSKCIKLCEEYASSSLSFVIDNTNPDIDSRKIYIDIAKKYKYNIRCFIIECDMNTAFHTSHYRSYINDGSIEHIPIIAYRIFNKKFQKPTMKEGFSDIISIPFSPPNNPDFFLFYY